MPRAAIPDLKARLGRIVVGYTRDGTPVTAQRPRRSGAMTAAAQGRAQPNLVQTLEGMPAFVHGGPFANIAHGTNSIIATKTALTLADFVVTEAGFGFDLGAEKFFDIKCRGGFAPACAVLVATIRALKMHGGVTKDDLKPGGRGRGRAGPAQPGRPTSRTRSASACRPWSRSTSSAPTPKAEIKLVEEKCKALRRRSADGRSLGDGRRGRGQCGARP